MERYNTLLTRELLQTIQQRQWEKADLLIKQDIDFSFKQYVLVLGTIIGGNLDFLDCLVEKITSIEEFRVENKPEAPFILAHGGGNIEAIKILIEKGFYNPYNTQGNLLLLPCMKNDINIVQYLLSKGFSAEKESTLLLLQPCQYSSNKLIKILVENGAKLQQDDRNICQLLRQYNLEMLEYLVEKGLSLDILEKIIDDNVCPNASNIEINLKDCSEYWHKWINSKRMFEKLTIALEEKE